jgi:hypothetical protein
MCCARRQGLTCAPGTCGCIDNGHFCDKFCGCMTAECLNRFPGCQCKSDKRRCRTSCCPCYAAHRECDPDTCMCGAAAQLPARVGCELPAHCAPQAHRRPAASPVPPAGTAAAEAEEAGADGAGGARPAAGAACAGGATCGNVHLLTRRHATLRMGVSEVSGWGVFSTRALERDEFVYEYMGEVISHDEADRRGSIYDKFNHSFLFNLNSATVVDAGRKGNKVPAQRPPSHLPRCVTLARSAPFHLPHCARVKHAWRAYPFGCSRKGNKVPAQPPPSALRDCAWALHHPLVAPLLTWGAAGSACHTSPSHHYTSLTRPPHGVPHVPHTALQCPLIQRAARMGRGVLCVGSLRATRTPRVPPDRDCSHGSLRLSLPCPPRCRSAAQRQCTAPSRARGDIGYTRINSD